MQLKDRATGEEMAGLLAPLPAGRVKDRPHSGRNDFFRTQWPLMRTRTEKQIDAGSGGSCLL